MSTTNNVPNAPKPAPKSSFVRSVVKFLLLLLLVIVLAVAGYTWVTLNFGYSSGERAGFLQKLSKKGWVCKTWEGELSLVALPGAAPEKFEFSVRDDAVAARINAAVGQRVTLTYDQHKGIPSSCFGETEYFITKVQPIGQ